MNTTDEIQDSIPLQTHDVTSKSVRSTGQLYRAFVSYTAHPVYLAAPEASELNRLLLWRLFKMNYSLMIAGFISYPILTLAAHLTGDSFKQVHDHSDPIRFAFLAIIVAPLVEEFIWRFGLRLTPLRSSFLLAFSCLFAINSCWEYVPSVWGKTVLFGVGFLSSVRVFMYANKPENFARMDRWWQANFRFIFYGSALLFGLAHMKNVPSIGTNHILLAPLLTLPQIVLGTSLGYTRMAYGYWYNVVIHAMANSIAVLISAFL